MKKTLIVTIILLIAVGFYFGSRHTELAPENSLETEDVVQEQKQNIVDDKPVIYGLGINIDKLDGNKAGDIIFTKDLVYDDGYISGNKAFIDFGVKEKYYEDSIGLIEYWFYVPLKTSVKAPLSGKVTVSYFEHTKDWGININQEGSEYIVSFEHLVNLNFKEGDIVNVGDIVGEAAPRNVPNSNSNIAMVELAIWKGGSNIIKFCPFDFIDESLKPSYMEKINTLANEWEEFIGKDVYRQEDWVSPGCLTSSIVEN